MHLCKSIYINHLYIMQILSWWGELHMPKSTRGRGLIFVLFLLKFVSFNQEFTLFQFIFINMFCLLSRLFTWIL